MYFMKAIQYQELFSKASFAVLNKVASSTVFLQNISSGSLALYVKTCLFVVMSRIWATE